MGNKKLLIIVILVIVAAITLTLIVASKSSFFGRIIKQSDTSVSEDMDINSWKDLSLFVNSKLYDSMSEIDRELKVTNSIENLKNKYGFDSYDINFKAAPLIVSLYFPDGHIEGIELSERNPKEN